LFIAAFLLFFSPLRKRTRFIWSGILIGIGSVGFFLLQTWNPLVMNAGVYLYGDKLAKMERQIDSFVSDYRLLFYREESAATVSVFENKKKDRFLRINGKTDGSNIIGERSDNHTQILLGLLPLIYHEKPQDALVVGAGTGITVGSVLSDPTVQVDCVEISPAVVEASHYFNSANGNALASPRVTTRILDGRTWLMAMPKKYDVIISEPSHPWQTGNANLFTTDFFELSVKKLKQYGVFCQWLPYYGMDKEHFKILVNSFLKIFPYVNAWIIYSDVILIGSNDPLAIHYQHLQDLTSLSTTRSFLSAIRINSIPELLSFFYLDTPGVKKFIQETKKLNTDNDPIIEFSAPKYLLQYQTAESFFEMFQCSFDARIPVINSNDLKQLEKDRVLERIAYFRKWGVPDEAIQAMVKAYDY
jgi:spermidine synthase